MTEPHEHAETEIEHDVAMQPGMYVQPGETAYVVKGQVMPDGRKWVVLRFEHSTGTTTLPLPVEFAAGLGQALLDEADKVATAIVPVASRLIVPADLKPGR